MLDRRAGYRLETVSFLQSTGVRSPLDSIRLRRGRRAPLVLEHGVHDEVDVARAEALAVADDALLRESEALRDRAAAGVADRHADLDAVQPPHVEGVIDELSIRRA